MLLYEKSFGDGSMEAKEFEKLYMQHMNSQQREAVSAAHGAVLLLAVPGSGKTTVLVTRLGYMILCCNISPENILTMTYTVAATAEMRNRFSSLFGEELGSRMEIRTINGVSSRIINFYSRNISHKEPFALESSEGKLIQIIKTIYREQYSDYADDSTARDIKTAITYAKNMQLNDLEIEAMDIGVKKFPQIYKRYNSVLMEKQLMDYDDQMAYALKILKAYPQVLEYFRNQYRYICVDEAQDTSKIQHEIIKLLAQGSNNIFMVGDEDQSIYGFRAAYPEALLSFEKDYPNARLLMMEQNYRSTPEIVSAADSFIKKSKSRRDKHMFTANDSGLPVEKIYAQNRETQLYYLFEAAKNCTEETAVLYRNNDSALPLIDMFEREKVPYNIRRFDETFFSHKVVSDICDIISFSKDTGNTDIFMRIYYKLGCPISKNAAQYACRESERSGKPILEALLSYPELPDFGKELVSQLAANLSRLPSNSAATALMRIYYSMHYSGYVEQNKLDKGKLDILMLIAEKEESADSFKARLAALKTLITEHKSRPEVKLELSTVHSAKGLEYERVYLLDVIDGILPAKNEIRCDTEEELKQFEEERRLFYVAMTRAKAELYIFLIDKSSQFVSELCAILPKYDTAVRTGEKCFHKLYGSGTAAAHHRNKALVSFASGYKLVNIGELTDVKTMNEQKLKMFAPAALVLSNGDTVKHKVYGEGKVTQTENGFVTIKFSAGEKRMLLSALVQNRLIEKV